MSPLTLPHLPPHLILHLPRTCLLTSKCSIDTSSSGRFYTATPCSLCMVHIFLHMLCFLSPKHFPSPASPQPLTPPVVISPVPCHVHVHSFSLLRELLHPLTCHLWLSEKLPHTDNSALAFSDYPFTSLFLPPCYFNLPSFIPLSISLPQTPVSPLHIVTLSNFLLLSVISRWPSCSRFTCRLFHNGYTFILLLFSDVHFLLDLNSC